MAENALFRQQLIVASRRVKRPAFQPHQRGLLALLARLVPRWRDALLLVKGATVRAIPVLAGLHHDYQIAA
jgi:hypothetical protein